MALCRNAANYNDAFHPIALLFPFFIFRLFTFHIGNLKEDISIFFSFAQKATI